MRPLLSIITINYNNAAGLRHTIESVFSQTFTQFEYIIVDGDSTDGSKQEIDKHRLKISKAIIEKDSGIYNAMNKGILSTSGKYSYFLNSGDRFFNEHVLADVFDEEHDAEFIYGNILLTSENGKPVLLKSRKELTMFDFFHKSINHQAVFIKSDVFEKYGRYNEALKIVADWELFVRAIVLGNASTLYIDKTIAICDTSGVSSTNYAENVRERELVLSRLIPRFMDDYKQMNDLLHSRIYKIYRKAKAIFHF